MKYTYDTIFVLAGIIFLIYSCQQLEDDLPEQFESEVEEVVNNIAENLLTITITGGEDDQPFRSGRFLGGEDSYLTSTSKNREKDLISMIACIDSEQIQSHTIRRLFFIFENCKSSLMVSYSNEITKLMVNMEDRRLELLEDLRRGAISREEHIAKVEELRKSYDIEMEELKDSYKEELIPCLKGFVSKLQINLGREDWLKFRKCVGERKKPKL